jgi:hypothetical protein
MAKDQEPQDMTNEFVRISSAEILRQYEDKNKERIAQSDFATRESFDKKWMQLTGKGYYQPVTSAPLVPFAGGQNYTENSCPKDADYCETIQFESVSWQKLPRRKVGKRFVDLYNLSGIDQSGDERPIYQNVDNDRLSRLLGVKARDKIISIKDSDHGEIKGPFDIKVEGYWEVQFAPQSNANDTRDVQLLWEGQCLIIQRMQNVILPGFYIEVADNATQDNFTQEPSEGRKKIGTVQKFPYMVKRQATRKEYLERKAYGDKIQREKLLREESL